MTSPPLNRSVAVQPMERAPSTNSTRPVQVYSHCGATRYWADVPAALDRPPTVTRRSHPPASPAWTTGPGPDHEPLLSVCWPEHTLTSCATPSFVESQQMGLF